MNLVNSAIVGSTSAADQGSVQQAASVSVMKKAMSAQAASVAQLISSLPQPALSTSGTVGTQVNTFA